MAVAVADANQDPTQRRYRGCSKITDYDITGKLGEGTFGVVSKGISRRTGAVVALKKILMHNEKDGFPITALREIKLLKMLSHPNVVTLEEMAVERSMGDGKKRAIMYMITPYMDHDLSGMTTNPDIQFTIPQIKCYLRQLLEGLEYLHDSHILHRDMKAANILISNKGQLQIADFGLARHYEGMTPQPGKGNGVAVRDYTTLVVTRWYRPPELLLQLRKYTPAIDMWGAGCVFAELFERRPILEGKTDVNQAEIIFELVGSPTEENMPGWSTLPGCEGVRQWATKRGNIVSRFQKRMGDDGLDLLRKLLTLDWQMRINAHDALKHPYFTTRPLPARPEEIPRFEDSHELDRRKHHEKRAALPPAPAGGTVGMGPDEWGPPGEYGGFHDRRQPGGYNSRGPPGQPAPPDGRGPYNGTRYDNRDRDYSRDHDRDRGGPPPGRSDERDRDDRRPAWQRGPPPDANSRPHPLPLPHSSAGPRNGSAEPDRRGPGAVDTYIPSYSDGGNRPPPRREEGYRDREGRDRDRDRDRRDWDRERDRDRGDRDVGRPRIVRSRSPMRDRERDWERHRDDDRRDRDRNGRDVVRDRDRDARDGHTGRGDRDRDQYRDRDGSRAGGGGMREQDDRTRERLQKRETDRYRM